MMRVSPEALCEARDLVVRRARRRQAGMTLDQALLYIVLIGLVVALGIYAYTLGTNMINSMQVKSQRDTLVASVRSVFANRSTYSELNNDLMVNIGRVSTDMLDHSTTPATIVNKFGMPVTVEPTNIAALGDGAFDLTFDGLSKDACQGLSGNGEFLVVEINGTQYDVAGVMGGAASPPTANDIANDCATNFNSVTWTYN
jgi:hypothetical protein